MWASKLKIPKIWEQYRKPFKANTVTIRFCSSFCANAAGEKRKKQSLEEEQNKQILQESALTVTETQTRLNITIAEQLYYSEFPKRPFTNSKNWAKFLQLIWTNRTHV